MATYLLKKSFQLKDLKETKFKDLWGDHGVFTTMWIFGKPTKILFFESHIRNLIKSLKTYGIMKKSLKKDILKLINKNLTKNKKSNHLLRVALNKKIISVTKGWTDAYYNFFMAGEADMVLSYTTSPAAHIMFEERNDILATTFEEGNYITIEFAGILNNSQNKDLANKFLNFMLSEEFQSVIPSTNIMYPITNIKDLPEAFDKLDVPNFIQMDPKEINKNKEKWIDEWLNAS